MSSEVLQFNSMTTFDLVVLGILGLSAIVAFFRGFLKELLSFLAWVGAAAFTIYFFPHADDLMKSHVKDPRVAAGGGAIVTYIIALMTISIINSAILKYAKNATDIGLLDNFLGFAFGALRGAFVLSFGFLILSAVVPKGNLQPEWLKNSITRPYLKQGAEFLVQIAPGYMVEMEGTVKKQVEHENLPQNFSTPQDAPKDYRPGFDPALR